MTRQQGKTTYFLEIDGITVTVEHKRVKNINLSVYPPDGRVRVSAPRKCGKDIICQTIAHRINWIKRQQASLKAAVPVHVSRLVSGEDIAFLGESLVLEVRERLGRPDIKLTPGKLVMQVRPGNELTHRQKTLDSWLRLKLSHLLPPLICRWAEVVGVEEPEWRIRKMKTRWGTCNVRDRRIWLNLELVKLKPVFLEYVLVHELVHLHERSHNARYWSLMDRFYPQWPQIRYELKNIRM